MQIVPFYLLLKLRVHNSGLGGGKTGLSAHSYQGTVSFLHTVLVLVLERDQKGILPKVVSEAHSITMYAEQWHYSVYAERGHGTGNMIDWRRLET